MAPNALVPMQPEDVVLQYSYRAQEIFRGLIRSPPTSSRWEPGWAESLSGADHCFSALEIPAGCWWMIQSMTENPVPGRVALFIFDFWLRPNDDDDTIDMVEFG